MFLVHESLEFPIAFFIFCVGLQAGDLGEFSNFQLSYAVYEGNRCLADDEHLLHGTTARATLIASSFVHICLL